VPCFQIHRLANPFLTTVFYNSRIAGLVHALTPERRRLCLLIDMLKRWRLDLGVKVGQRKASNRPAVSEEVDFYGVGVVTEKGSGGHSC